MVKAILHAEGLEINLRYFEYSIGKHADDSGLPYGQGSLLDVIVAIEATKENTWFEYAIANHRSISKMIIELQPAILGQRSRYINMYDCHILNFKTSFSSENNQPLTETFRISAQGMEQSHSSTVYSTPFRKTFDSDDFSKEIKGDELSIIDCYYTDLQGNEIYEPKVNDEIYVVLQTKNGIGEVTDINLANNRKDFLYNGKVLKDDILKDYLINSDEEKIKLTVIAQQEEKKRNLRKLIMPTTVTPRNKLNIRFKKVTTAYIAKKTFTDDYSGETYEYTFKSDGNRTHNQKRKEYIAQIIFNNETKKGNLNTTNKRTTIAEIVSVLTKDKYNKGDCISISLLKSKVKFTRINQANLGDDICIVVKTENLQGREIKMNLKQRENKVLTELNKAIVVNQNNKDIKLITATVGEFSEKTNITNGNEFKDWAIAELKLVPKDTKLKKNYTKALSNSDLKSAKLYITIDAEIEKHENWVEVIYEEVFDGVPNVWLRDEENSFEVVNNLWHGPILNPQRLLYNSSGNFSPKSGSFGYVRKVFKDGKLIKKAHAGIDIFAPIGETVYACMNGEVVSAKLRGSLTSGYGNTIIIKVDKEDLDLCKNNYQLEFSMEGEKIKGPSFGDSNDRYFLYAHLKTNEC